MVEPSGFHGSSGGASSDSMDDVLFDLAPSPLFLATWSGRVLKGNREFTRVVGWTGPTPDAAGLDFSALLKDEGRWDHLRHRLTATRRVEGEELAAVRVDGSPMHLRLDLRIVRLNGQPERILASAREVSEQRAREERLLHDALHDAVTGLANRGVLQDQLRRMLNTLKRKPENRGVLIALDLEGFDDVVRRWGKLQGDAVLAEVASRIRGSVRGSDLLARLGQDEFMVLLDGVNGKGDIQAVTGRLHQALEPPVSAGSAQINLGARIALLVFDGTLEDPGALLETADRAIFEARAASDGTVLIKDLRRHDA
jgi:diguanylate cyclase (GGDEF)-like protein/PAS domain S-box-containing protein